jgi:K+-transporting ATPase KdpF subunit
MEASTYDGFDLCNGNCGLVSGFHLRFEAFYQRTGKTSGKGRIMENLIMGLIGLFLIIYLFYSLFRPDRF